MSTPRLYRQGDVLLVRVPRPRKALQPMAPEAGRLILARGEVTGHHHSVEAGAATLNLEEGGVMYLTVAQLTDVRHQEHAPLTVPPGTYRVQRQREYTPEEIRTVAD